MVKFRRQFLHFFPGKALKKKNNTIKFNRRSKRRIRVATGKQSERNRRARAQTRTHNKRKCRRRNSAPGTRSRRKKARFRWTISASALRSRRSIWSVCGCGGNFFLSDSLSLFCSTLLTFFWVLVFLSLTMSSSPSFARPFRRELRGKKQTRTGVN